MAEYLGYTTANRWAWIYPPEDQCPDPCQKHEGTLARFMIRRGDWFVFIDHESFEGEGRHTAYLIRDDELRIRWIGKGTNANGAWMHGDDLERAL